MARFYVASSAALAAVLLSAPAQADVTADDVWNDWQAYLQTFGDAVTAETARSGDTLTVSNFSMDFDLSSEAEPTGDLTISIPEVTFTEQGDGTVAIGMSDRVVLLFTADERLDEQAEATVHYDQVNFRMTASGTPAAITYDYATDSATLALTQLLADGQPLPPEAAKAALTIAGISGQTTVNTGDLRTYAQTMTMGAITGDFAFTNPSGSESATINYAAAGARFDGTSSIPMQADVMDDVATSLRSGFGFDVTFAATGSQTDVAFTSPEGPGQARLSAATNSIGFGLTPQSGLRYDVRNTDLDVAMMLPEVPLPIVGSLGSTQLTLGLPVLKADDPQTYALTLELNDLVVSDMIWGMVDPGGQLPRDPATLQIATNGLAKVLVDYMSAGGAGGGLHAEVQSLNLTNLALRVAGAALTGSGAMTFDATRPGLAGPLGTPVGAVDLRLEGGATLMQTLVQMGLLPQEQAMGAQMMLGLFARPVEGATDTVESRIEINDQGHILANGQRIQ